MLMGMGFQTPLRHRSFVPVSGRTYSMGLSAIAKHTNQDPTNQDPLSLNSENTALRNQTVHQEKAPSAFKIRFDSNPDLPGSSFENRPCRCRAAVTP